LAEILFNSNHLKEAAKCYQQALDRITANETDRFADKEWLLFQIGNCLRNTDRQAAMQIYSQLIAEYPDSPWVDLANAKSKLIDWYLKDKPDALIKEYKL
jgi:TolA-binding protein